MTDCKTYIDGNKTRRILNINWSIWRELSFSIVASLQLKQDLFLPNFSEVKLGFIKGLEDFIDPEFSWSLLEVATLIKLSNETILSRNNLTQ